MSVIVPLYNHVSFVAAAVHSALDQGQLLREVIIVDDGSTDGSAEAGRALSVEDSRVVFWSQPNRGAHAAINAGLLRATGDLLAVLNSDDIYEPGRLDVLVAALDASPGIGMAASGLGFMDGAGVAMPYPWYDEALAFYHGCGDLGTALVNGNFLMTTSNYVLRRNVLDRVGLFAPLRYAHDLDFALRLLLAGEGVALVPEPLLRYRVHGANTIKEDHAQVRLEWAIAAAAYLVGLLDRPCGEGLENWFRAKALLEVLDRHALARAVYLCMAYLRQHPGTLDRSPIMRESAFREFLLSCL